MKPTGNEGFWGLSFFWDVFLPLGLTGVPAAIWMVWGWVIGGFDRPGAPMPVVTTVVMVVLQVAGIVALAFVALTRREMAKNELKKLFPEGLPEWRDLCLFLAIICITLFDLLANLATTISGALFLLWGAVPFYLGYLGLIRLALWGTRSRAT